MVHDLADGAAAVVLPGDDPERRADLVDIRDRRAVRHELRQLGRRVAAEQRPDDEAFEAGRERGHVAGRQVLAARLPLALALVGDRQPLVARLSTYRSTSTRRGGPQPPNLTFTLT